MKFSVNWLREFAELPSSVDELADLLTMAGIEIEGGENRGGEFENVVVAQIRESKPHPNADRLSVCTADDGSGALRQIVCGAKNYKAGDKVPLALPGAHLPNGLTIKKSKLRGVESEGMLCSPIELALGDDASGLLILSADAPVGAPLSKLFPPDTIFDVEITPNRPDLLSHFGLAREISALTGGRLSQTPGPLAETPSNAGVHISARRECPFYSARRIENVQVGPSPEWLRARIESVGIRSINNIVDITNYVMLELGQPLHAFDADKLNGGIEVRLAQPGEKFLALDGRSYSLGEADLVIADQQRAIGLGGVMGGEETGVTSSTRNVLLEAAYFLPTSIRRTARMLNLPSDSSYRFERGVDPGMVLRASQRASELMREIARGEPVSSIATAGELPRDPANIALRYARAIRVVGLQMTHAQIDEILKRFGLQETGRAELQSWWKIPSYRRDLAREEDLIEEIVRAIGVETIPSANRGRFTASSEADRAFDFQMQLRERLVACGFFEAKTSALVRRGLADALELRNPLSEEHVALRPSLISGLLGVLERNLRGGANSVRLFELGRAFNGQDAREHRALALLLNGTAASQPHWRAGQPRNLDLFDAKGALDALGLPELSFRRATRDDFALAAQIFLGNEMVGFMGQLSAADVKRVGATAPVVIAELQLEPLFHHAERTPHFSEIDRFPSITRDIAMVVPESLAHEEIDRVITSTNEPLLADVQLFDLFAGKGAESLGVGRRSLAYSLTYRDKNRTLTSDEVTAVHARIRERLKSELGAELRE